MNECPDVCVASRDDDTVIESRAKQPTKTVDEKGRIRAVGQMATGNVPSTTTAEQSPRIPNNGVRQFLQDNSHRRMMACSARGGHYERLKNLTLETMRFSIPLKGREMKVGAEDHPFIGKVWWMNRIECGLLRSFQMTKLERNIRNE
jgi:hypothetical protein